RLERGATPPLLHVQSDESNVNFEENCCRSGEDLVHFRTDASRHLVSGERPALFFLRPNENLAVTRIKGSGRLLVTLREEAGAEVVAVDGAIVHDSAAHFGDAAIHTDHRFPYVAGHRYEFQVVPAQGVELAVRGNVDRQGAAASRLSQSKKIPIKGLHVVFSVTSAYSKGARLCEKDAMQVSLPTFEATSPEDAENDPATVASFVPAATKITQSSSTFVASAEGSCSSPNPRLQAPGSAGDTRSSKGAVAEELGSPYVSPPPVGAGYLNTPQSGVEASGQRSLDPAPGPVLKAPAVHSSDIIHGGNMPSNFATRPSHSETIAGMIQGDKALAGRLRWNPAWEKQDLLQSSFTPAQASRQKYASTLPNIRRHLEQTSPRSGFYPQESSGYEGISSRMNSVVGGDGYVRPTGYSSHDLSVQSTQHEVPGGAGDETQALRYHQSARDQQHNAPPVYYERVVVSPGPYGAGSTPEAVRNQRQHFDKTSTAAVGGGSNWERRRDDMFVGASHGEGQANTGNYEHGRWRGQGSEGQGRNGGPELRRSEQGVSQAGHHYTTGEGQNGDGGLKCHRFHHSSERGKGPSFPGRSNGRGGYMHGGGILPQPGESPWERTKTMGTTPS
ncbi:unnamed protein product, partial [Hapterophycus canaliculatus]